MAVVRALRQAEHDVRAIAEESPGVSDERVAAVADADQRVVLTEDRDFGRLVYAQLHSAIGVIYMRYPTNARTVFARDVVDLVRREGDALVGAFVVMQPGRARVSRLPER